MFMIMLVLDNLNLLDQVLDAWSEAQISGCTIVESSGLYRRQVKHIPLRYVYGTSVPQESGNVTLFAVVENENLVQACLAATEKVTGDLDQPDTGIFAAWPVYLTKGMIASAT